MLNVLSIMSDSFHTDRLDIWYFRTNLKCALAIGMKILRILLVTFCHEVSEFCIMQYFA